MAQIAESVVALRVSGDTLVPEEISRLLGCEPSFSYRKGDIKIGEVTKTNQVRKTGMWGLQATDRKPEALDEQVMEILSKVSSRIDVWIELASRFEVDLFCGLFMESSNDGLELSTATLSALGERRIALGLDIYGPIEKTEA